MRLSPFETWRFSWLHSRYGQRGARLSRPSGARAPSFPQLHGSTMYEFLAEHGDLEAVFNRFMSAQSNLHNAAIVEAYDFSKIQALVDVGGGHGATVGAILARYPTMKGVVFDRPEVIATAEVCRDPRNWRSGVGSPEETCSSPSGWRRRVSDQTCSNGSERS